MSLGWKANPRWTHLALGAVALGALALRLLPLLREAGPLGYPIDYDEGVYFSASALLFKGVLPYRDFVFVHPPALLYFLGLTTSLVGPLDAAQAFGAARLVAALVGACNVYLLGRVLLRAAGPLAAFVGAALYATYPEVVVVERGPYLEPVLNLACFGLAYVWLSPRKDSSRGPLWAGVLAGLAMAVKVWGGIWMLAALASIPAGKLRSQAPRLVGAASVTFLLLLSPLVLPALGAFLEQALLFHALRPPDGDLDRLGRLTEIFSGRHLAASALALLYAAWAVGSRLRGKAPALSADARFFLTAWGLTLVAFLASSAYWSQYNSHLAVSECALAGLGASLLWRPLANRLTPRALLPVASVLVLALTIPSWRRCVLAARARAPELAALGQAIRAQVPEGACLFSFEPAWTVVGGRLPAHEPGAPVVVDSYAAMLLSAVRGGARYPDAQTAFQSELAQPQVRSRLEACRYAVLGWRGDWQLSSTARAWFESRFRRVPTPGASGLELWERRP